MYSHGSPPVKLTGGSINRKRSLKRGTWGDKKRAGMSFMIIIAFFSIFGLIILTEIFMIDDKSKIGSLTGGGIGSGIRHGSTYNRIGESAPDYEDVKVEYSMESVFMRNHQNNNDKNNQIPRISAVLSNAVENRNSAGGGGGGGGAGGGMVIPWGALLPTSIENTLPIYPMNMQPTDGIWQIVNGTRYKFFVYSAFYDRRSGGRVIRVIGATKTRGPEKVWCRLWYPLTSAEQQQQQQHQQQNYTGKLYKSLTVMARVKVIRENWNLKYSACFVLCPLRINGIEVPYSVSIVSKIRSPPGNILLLRNTDQDVDFVNHSITDIPDKISVCVKPLHFNYDSALYLMEFLELNALLGVTHFTFYNHTLGPHASCVLKHYSDGSLVAINNNNNNNNNNNHTIYHNNNINYNNSNNNNYSNVNTPARPSVFLLPWELNMRSQKEIRTEGLFAALNDCLYRNMYRYQYLALIDLDEFIIPKYNDTLNDLFKWITFRLNGKNSGAYSFQNAFFYLQFADDELMYNENVNNAGLRAALVTQRKTRRRSKLHPQKQRSKYICRPEAVVEAGNHFVWEYITGKGSLNVPADAGILHHYRVCEFGGDDCVKTASIVDRTAHKYMQKLVERVDYVYNLLKKPCDLLDLPDAPVKPIVSRKKRLTLKEVVDKE